VDCSGGVFLNGLYKRFKYGSDCVVEEGFRRFRRSFSARIHFVEHRAVFAASPTNIGRLGWLTVRYLARPEESLLLYQKRSIRKKRELNSYGSVDDGEKRMEIEISIAQMI
jgi:hypothetical protein